MQKGHESGDLRPVGQVVGRISWGIQRQGAVVGADSDVNKAARNQVVHHGHALAGQLDGAFGEQDVVVDQRRAVGNLHKDVLADAGEQGGVQLLRGLSQVRRGVVVEQIPGDAGALGLPVQPDAAGTVVDVVAPDGHVDGRVHLDAADLRASEILLVVDVVDVIVFNGGEYTAQVADDAGLPAVVDVAAAHGVGAYGLLRPALGLGQADALALRLGAVLVLPVEPLVVVVLLEVLPQRDAAALGFVDLTVFDDPALRPVRRDHALLECRRRSPLGRGLADSEAGERDITDALFRGGKAGGANGEFYLFHIGILALEVGVEHGLVGLRVLLGIPHVDGVFRIPGLGWGLRTASTLVTS